MSDTSSTWSPSRLGNKTTRLPRHLVDITKDQAELLNRSDAWVKPHIPPFVLNKIQTRSTKDPHQSPAAEASPSTRLFGTWSPSLLGTNTTTTPQQLVQVPEDQQNSLERTDIYSSPQISSKLSENVRAQASAQSPQRRLAVEPPLSPPPKPQRTKEQELAAVAELPFIGSTADCSEEEAGIQVPDGPIFTAPPPTELRASGAHIPPGPTPPSAQVIPCTYPEPSPVGSPPKQKRRRLMKNVAASIDPADLIAQPTRPSILSLPKPASPPRPASSSVLPSSSVTVSPMVIRTQQAILPAVTPVALCGGGLLESSRSSERSPNVSASQDPYNVFKETYPDYDGSLGDFVRGVLSLIPLQKRKTVPQYILDDYIRVFSGDYLEYIGQLKDGQRPLTTWEWYCDNVPRPVYTKGVLSSDNLKKIRRWYPDKVFSIEAQSTPAQADVRQPDFQHLQKPNVFSTPAPANVERQSIQQKQVSSPLFPHPLHEPCFIAAKSSIHVAELASDPISTAEDLPFETQPRTSNHHSTGAISPATKFISASARQSHAQGVRPVNMLASRFSSSSVRFETQVNLPSLERGSSGNSIWDHEDDAMEPVEGREVEGRPDEAVVDDHAPCPSLRSNLEQTAAGMSNSHIEYRLSDENSVEGAKRPWETIGDPEEQQLAQQQCFATFLAEVWGPQHTNSKQVRPVV